MEFKRLHGDVRLPSIGLGTWRIGGGMSPDHSRDKESVELLKKAIALGYTHIDTAELYGAGHCEELIGEAIRGMYRPKLFITSKVYSSNLRYDDVLKSCKASLERLGTSYIDLYLVHAPNPRIPVKETMAAMNELVDRGLARFIGVSNFSARELEEAQRYSRNKIVCNQVEYNLSTRNRGRTYLQGDIETEVIPYCRENDVLFVAYSPLDKGLLAGKHPLLDELSKKYGKTRAQVALNWLISKDNIVTIPKASSVEHLKENLGAVGWKLSPEDVKLLDDNEL